MKKLVGRVLIAALVIVLVLAALGAGGFVYLVRRPFPITDGTIRFDPGRAGVRIVGLSDNVEIIRDRFGIPHIYANTPEDLFKAQGFVHAQDRFFQMEFQRRIGQGRLSELFGKSALDQDKFIRTIGWARVAAEEEGLLSPQARLALQSYADGVNAYIFSHPDRLGLEFTVLGLIGRQWQPEPWTPLNTLTWGKAMSYNLGSNMDEELARLMLMEKGGAALTEAVIPPYPDDMPVIVRRATTGALDPWLDASGDARRRGKGRGEFVQSSNLISLHRLNRSIQQAIGLVRDPGVGSNNWVLAGSRTASGKPLLANDPHLGIAMPSIWYINGLHCRVVNDACPYDVVGVTFPGVPGVVLGHNARIAWGVTNAGPDTQDLFIERPAPDDPNAFEFMGTYEPAQMREEVIQVAGATPVTITVRLTRHGPIMNDVLDELKDAPPLALQWTALQPGTLFESVLRINRAQNWEQFREALRYWDTPSQNFVYADVEGNIGYQMPGNIPIRKSGDGRAPVPGWTGEHEWIGNIPFEELPFTYNPPEGYIVTANNAVVDADRYPYLLGLDWDRGYRAKRIEDLLNAKDRFTVDDMRRMHMDAYSIFAGEVLPYLEAVDIGADSLAAEALRRMQAWDKVCDLDAVGCAVFETFWRQLSFAAFGDEVGEPLADIVLGNGTHAQIALRRLLADPSAVWWDDTTTPERETRDQIIVRALKDAADRLRARLGDDVSRWTWGRLHTVTFTHQTLGRSGIAVIEAIFNRGPFPVEGSMGLVNAVGTDPRTFAASSGPSWRAVYDLSNWSASLGIHTTGQSGHAFHPHYDDMIALWLKGESLPLAWTREDVSRQASSTLILTP